METKVTYRRALDFEAYGRAYLQAYPKERSPLSFALNKVLERLKAPIQKFRVDINDEVDALRCEYRAKDKEGNFKEKTYGEGDKLMIMPVFEGKKEAEFKEKVRELEETEKDKELELKPHFVDLPPKLNIQFIEPFVGFVLKAVSEEDLEKHYMAQAEEEVK